MPGAWAWNLSSGYTGLFWSRRLMQVKYLSRILSLSLRPKIRDGFSSSWLTRHLPSWLVISLSPLWSYMFVVSWTILLQVCILYAHRFMFSGFRVMLVWFRLDHVRNPWRLSLSTCQIPRTTNLWTWQQRSTTIKLPAVIYLRKGVFQCV